MKNAPLNIGDAVRYSRSARRQYGLTKKAASRIATVTAIHNGYVTVVYSDKSERNLPTWALEPARLEVLEQMLGKLFLPD